MARTGGPVIDRYFAQAARVRKKTGPVPGNDRDRLNAIEAQMIVNARQYDAIRAAGRHPIWNTARHTWTDPRDHATEVLTSWIAKHRFHLDAANDRNVIERIVTDLYPEESRP
jgi:hypothetical protein